MSKAMILVDNGFEDIELLYPFYRLQETGLKVDIVGHKIGETYSGKKGASIMSDKSPGDLNIEDYRVMIIPGGWAPDRMRTKTEMVNLVREAMEKKLIVGAICHGAQMLIEADVVKGRNLTCVRSVSKDVMNAGGHYLDKPVVTDANLVTSRFPQDLPFWMPAVIKLLE